MSSLGGSPHGTRVEEREQDTQPLPAADPLDAADVRSLGGSIDPLEAVDVRPQGSPIDPLGDRHPDARPPVAPSSRPARPVPRTVWFFVIIAVLGLSAALGLNLVMGGLASLNPFKNGLIQQRTVDRSGPAVLKAVTDLGTLQSASGYYEIVIDVEKSVDNLPSFLAGRRVLFVAAGTVDATVDLRSLGSAAVTVDRSRTAATLRLPKPRLSQPSLDLKRSYVFDEQRGLIDRIRDAVTGSPDDERQLYTLASQRLTQAAQANDDLVNRAEANTRGVLQGLLRPLGFTDVTVTFAR
jgi:Protein of unknown function (DUF4230)